MWVHPPASSLRRQSIDPASPARGARCRSCYLVGGLGGAGLTVEPFGRLLMARERHFASDGVQGETSDLSERCWGDEHQHCTASAEGGHSPISEAHEPVANHVYGRFTCGLWTTPAEVHTLCGSHASATRQGRAYPATNERVRRWVWVPSLKRSPSGFQHC